MKTESREPRTESGLSLGMILAVVLSALGPRPSALSAPIPADQLEFFEKRIRPVLVDNCYQCHSQGANKSRGGLYVDTKPALLAGGDSGPAIVPGDPGASRLLKAIRYTDPDMEMPPDGKLPDYVIRDFETWIRNSAPDPRGAEDEKFVRPKSPKEHWAFQPVFEPIIPRIDKAWLPLVGNEIDYFVFSRLEANGLSPSPKADKITLIRRATFNLTGLPPTIDEVDAFLADTNANAFEAVIDRLLDSPRYGERWGRHWLDVARYGDTTGGNNRRNQRFFHSYTYRDWVIKAFNDDMPFSEFTRLQLAADRYVRSEDDPNLAAMGFLTLGNRFNNNRDDIIDDRIDVVTKGFLGLTVSCARCHDHKFDPIPTMDYYSLHGIFASSAEPNDPPTLATDTNAPSYLAFQAAVNAAEDRVAQFDRRVQYDVRNAAINDTAKYLFAAQLARQDNKEALEQYVENEELSEDLVRVWRKLLDQRAKADDPLFGLWSRLESSPTDKIRDDGIRLMRSLRDDVAAREKINQRLYRAFQSPPLSLGDMAAKYAALVIQADREWQTLYLRYSQEKQAGKTDAAPPTALDDPALEDFRQLIYDPASPAFLMSPQRWERAASRELRSNRELRGQREDLTAAIDNLKLNHPGAPARPVVLVDARRGGDSRVYVKGNRRERGDVAPRRFLEILSPEKRIYFGNGSGRQQLAEAIASEQNPLTARVAVNRVWLHQFGEGIVRSPNDFGTRCEGPSHPGLIDYLAWKFMENGWSLKKLQKHILLSHTWQQTSDDDPRKFEKDPSNLWLWQMNRRRLDFEALRDTILHIGGKLDVTMGGPPIRLDRSPYPTRRSIYGLIDRANLPDMFRAFDFPNPDATNGKRDYTIVPQQALFMMNSPLVLEQAANMVRRADLLNLRTNQERIQRLYRLIYSRPPNGVEMKLALLYLAREQTAPRGTLPGQPPWEYGMVSLNTRGLVSQFWPIYYNNQRRHWQPGRSLPDRVFGSAHLNAQGGHAPGGNQYIARRWTAPDDMLVAIAGNLAATGRSGDGVQGWIIFSNAGAIGRYTVPRGQSQSTAIPRVRVTAGSTLDFVIGCRGTAAGDNFNWAPVIRRLDAAANPPTPTGETWEATRQFRGPTGQRRLYPWEKLAQVLLETNELTFIN